MKAVIFPGDRKLEFLEFPDPTPGPGEVVLEIKASGMCGSDLKHYRASGGAASLGFKTSGGPVIAGHAPCGVMAAVGFGVPEDQTRVGMRVMQHHNLRCGVCPHCSTGWTQLCIGGVAEVYGATGHGAHARYMKCPARTLVPLPDELSFGADVLINPKTTENVVQAIKDLTHGLGAHLSLNASSSPAARAQAVRCVRTWGKACFVGAGDTVTRDVSNDLLRRQVTLIRSWTLTVGQADCARYIADRGIDVDRLFTHRWKLDQAEEAYQLFDKQTSGKGVILQS